MIFIIDFDGTLICPKHRIYKLFCELAPQPALSFDAYWALKMAGLSNADILRRYYDWLDTQINRFNSLWMSTIETRDYLKLDNLITGVPSALVTLKSLGALYLCTSRQYESGVVSQLQEHDIFAIFERVIVTGKARDKAEAILDCNLDLTNDCWLIGDTGKDVITSREINIRSCAVTTGVMNIFNLRKYAPDAIHLSIDHFAQTFRN